MSSCGRPGCNAPAAASIGFDNARLAVWLHPLDEPEATGRLCSHHADSLQPPRGWRSFDYREPAATREVVKRRKRRPAKQPAAAAAVSGGDVEELLNASTPLLERAFRGARAS